MGAISSDQRSLEGCHIGLADFVARRHPLARFDLAAVEYAHEGRHKGSYLQVHMP